MARYIDADDFYERLSNTPYTIYNGEMFSEWFEECFKMQLTADVEPVRHGRWVKVIGEDYVCSNCKAALWARKTNPVNNYKYCWSCGWKMDGDEDD